MPGCLESASSAKLPRWVTILASAAGLLMLGVGMSRFIRLMPISEVLLPCFVGSMLIYVSGFEKRLRMDDGGIYQKKAFWGIKREKTTPWDDVTDARVILNKGKNIYVLLHGADKMPPFILAGSQADEALELLSRKLSEEQIRVER